jgi:hypothetical protein
MLPIRLGMINANGPQDLIVYMLTKNGRVETTNYRDVRFPPTSIVRRYVKGDFARFYKSMFNEQARRKSYRVAFTDTSGTWAGAIRAPPIRCRPGELTRVGVFWLEPGDAPPIAHARCRRRHRGRRRSRAPARSRPAARAGDAHAAARPLFAARRFPRT